MCILKYVQRRVTNPREAGGGDDVNVKLTVDWNDDSLTKYIQVGEVASDSQQAGLHVFTTGHRHLYSQVLPGCFYKTEINLGLLT